MSTNTRSEEERVSDGIVYARILKIGVWLSLVLVAITFLLYIFSIIPAHVPVNELPKYWNLSVTAFQLQTGIQAGWGRIELSGDSDLLCLLAIALLSTVSLFSLAAVLIRYVARRELTYAVISVLNIAILILAASGVFGR